MGNKQRTAATGKKLGRYRIERELGRGGMGVVYVAVDENLGRRVALKTTSIASMGSSEQARSQRQARFLREVKALGQVNHENVVHVFDAGEADDPELGWLLFYTMQFVDGITLAQMVHRLGALNPGAAAAVCMQVAAGLGSAHLGGIVHRDVKPANIFIDKAGRALIGDFGICKLEGSTQITRRDQLVGTPNYLAPEQILGDEITPATDVFALGALFFVIATNSPLRTKVDPASLLAEAQTNEPRDKVMAEKRIAPDALRKIIGRALERDPKKRFKNCVEFAEALADYATKVPAFAEVTSDNMELPKANPGLGVDTSSSAFAPMNDELESDTPLAGGEAPEPFDFAGSGAAGVEEAALALLKDAGITEEKPKKTKADPSPQPEPTPELPVARVESTVMFNLRQMEDEEQAKPPPTVVKEDDAPLLEPKGGAPGDLPVARAESTVMFNLRQMEDDAQAQGAAPAPDATNPFGAMPISDPGAAPATDNPALDEATDQMPRGLSTEAPAPMEQPPVQRMSASAVQREARVPLDLPPPALYAVAAGSGLLLALFVLLVLGLLFGDDAPPPPVEVEPDVVAVAEPEPPPKQCRLKAKGSKDVKNAVEVVRQAKKDIRNELNRQALKKLRAAIRADPQNAQAHMLFAEMMAKKGEVKKAVSSFKCVVHLAPDSEIAIDAASRLEKFEKLIQD